MQSHKMKPVAHGRTRRPPTSTQMIKSRTHARGMPERNNAQCRARARGELTDGETLARARARCIQFHCSQLLLTSLTNIALSNYIAISQITFTPVT